MRRAGRIAQRMQLLRKAPAPCAVLVELLVE
jgi:hypothetical protein